MHARQRNLGLGIAAALGYFAYDWIGRNVEVATLHATGAHEHFATVFVVDDPPSVWIRAERPDRRWLASLRQNPEVRLQRGDHELTYHAEVWNGDGGHQHVDELFRAKYGVFDQLSAWIWRRDAVPVRLEPKDQLAG